MTLRIDGSPRGRQPGDPAETSDAAPVEAPESAPPEPITAVMTEMATFLVQARRTQREQARSCTERAVAEQMRQVSEMREQASVIRGNALAQAITHGISAGLRGAQFYFSSTVTAPGSPSNESLKSLSKEASEAVASGGNPALATLFGGLAGTADLATQTVAAFGDAAAREREANAAEHGANATRHEGQARQHEEAARDLRATQAAVLDGWRSMLEAEHAARRAILKG